MARIIHIVIDIDNEVYGTDYIDNKVDAFKADLLHDADARSVNVVSVRHRATSVPCPYCGAAAGSNCQRPGGETYGYYFYVHKGRIREWDRTRNDLNLALV